MRELQDELMTYIPRLVAGINEMACLIQSNNMEKAFQLLNQVIDGLDWVNKAYCGFPNKSSENSGELNRFVADANKAIFRKDYILVADIFEYEINKTLKAILLEVSGFNFN